MTWAKVADDFDQHLKVLVMLGKESPEVAYMARGVWVSSLAWSSRMLSDGAIPKHWMATSLAPQIAIDALVKYGLWDVTPDGYQIHDFLDYNPSREEVIANRVAVNKRVAKFRDRRRNGDGNAVCNTVSNGVGNATPVPVLKKEEEFSDAPAREEQAASQEAYQKVTSWVRISQLYETATGRPKNSFSLEAQKYTTALTRIAVEVGKETGFDHGEAFDAFARQLFAVWIADDWVKSRLPKVAVTHLANQLDSFMRIARQKAREPNYYSANTSWEMRDGEGDRGFVERMLAKTALLEQVAQ